MMEKPPVNVQSRQRLPLVALSLSPEVGERVTAHEILHTMKLIHDDAIMCAGINVQITRPNAPLKDHGGTITDAQLLVMRQLSKPDFRPDPNADKGCP